VDAETSVTREFVFAHSMRGRPVRGWLRGDEDGTWTVLVVGVIHGDETAGLAIVRALRDVPVPPRRA
jgi:hypothetical protein